jgi:hypothetical protein
VMVPGPIKAADTTDQKRIFTKWRRILMRGEGY